LVEGNPHVSIIVLNHNGSRIQRIFHECIDSLLATEYRPLEVILADNGSSDHSTEDIIRLYGNGLLRAVWLKGNLGTAGGNNAAFEQGSLKGEMVVFVNNDVIFGPDWLTELVCAMKRNNNLAACGPVVVEGDLEVAGGYCTAAGAALQLHRAPSLRIYEQGYATGSCILIRSSVFRRLNGFNADFFMYHDEVDLCTRIRSLGFSVGCVPSVRVFHYGSQTSKALKLKSVFYYMARNRFLYLYIYRTSGDLVFAIPLAIASTLEGSLYYLLKHDSAAFRLTVLGMLSGLFMCRSIISRYRRKPFKDPMALPILADFLHLLPKNLREKHLQRMMATLVTQSSGRLR
jgi:GT2 family glycosyltransferase